MKKEEVIKWFKIMKANLNTFPEISSEKKIEALAEAIRLLKNEQSIDKIDCDHTDCNNCVNHKYCDYESNKSEIPTSSVDCIDRKEFIDWINVWNITPIIKRPLIRHVQGMSSVTPQEPTDKNDNQILEDIKVEILEQYWGDSRKEYFTDNDSKEYIDGTLEAADYIIKMIDKHKRK